MGSIAGTPDGSHLPRGGATTGGVRTPGTVPGPGGGLDRIGETGGRIAGGALGGVIGGALGGPVGAWIGRGIGSRVGGAAGRGAVAAGRAAAGALADMMATANKSAEEETRDQEAAVPCENCAQIPCFNYPDGADAEKREEFDRQLKDQQDAINEMSPDEVIDNMDSFTENGRPPGDAAARRQAGNDWIRDRAEELRDEEGLGREAAEAQARQERSGLAALHTPDLIAGGSGLIKGMGDKGVNSSLGSQWRHGRAAKLREAAEEARARGEETMDVSLEPCDDAGGPSPPGGRAPGQGDPGLGQNSSIPMS